MNTSPCSQPAVTDHDKRDIGGEINAAYSARAREGVDREYARNVADAFGYTPDQLASLPEGAHLGLSCGNPLAVASIRQGEVVVDLGSGGGADVLLAAPQVGPNGQAIGLDASMDMINLARRNADKKGLKPPQVSFAQSQLTEPLPIQSDTVDCVLSNCVVNLLPLEGKANLLNEVCRILKPGGRVVLDDIVARKCLPVNIKNDIALYVGCVSGAILEDEYRKLLNDAGFRDVLLVDTQKDLNVYFDVAGSDATGCCQLAQSNAVGGARPGYDINEWVASFEIYAIKPGKSENRTGDPSPEALAHWWDAFPTVRSNPPKTSAEEVSKLILSSDPDFAVIDVRRNDYGGGHVRGSHNRAAQSFHNDLPQIFEEFKNTKSVIFYCGSSNGRGPRCAGWYQDYLDSQPSDSHSSKAYVLEGGIKHWKGLFDGRSELVEE